MFPSVVLALLSLQLIASSAAAAVKSSASIYSFNTSMATSSNMETLGNYPVPRTLVSLKIHSSSAQRPIPERYALLCIIEAQEELAATLADDPIRYGHLAFQFGNVKFILEDLGTPRGRFTNDIAAWTLRGLAEWMSNMERFREVVVGVYYNEHYCGTAMVLLVDGQEMKANATTGNTETSAAVNAATSTASSVETA